MKSPSAIYLLGFLLLFLAISGLAGGALLMIQPNGSLLKMESGWLNGTPFSNYFVPGFLLFVSNGVLPLIAFLGLFLKGRWTFMDKLNLYSGYYWGWALAIYSGIASIIWITIQQIMTRYFWVQSFILTIALLIIISALIPSTIKYYSKK